MSTFDILQALPRLFRSADLYKFTGNANLLSLGGAVCRRN